MSQPLRVEITSAARAARLWRPLSVILSVAMALFVFILALEVLKSGAGGVAGFLRALRVAGAANTLGFGWLMAYLVLSGSPVAAISLTLFGGGTLSPLETFAMINGSRFGASFIVLFTGFLYYLRGIRGRGVVAMGVLSMATTATIYLPAMLLGGLVLRQGWLDGIGIGTARLALSPLDRLFDPIVASAAAVLPPAAMFAAGVVLLLLAFRLFDQALPGMDSDFLETRWGRWLDTPRMMFLLGLLVTSLTLSVSTSLSILVPLAGRGYVQRDQVIPYIMGANISTFVDTLAAALLIQSPLAFTIVLTEMLSVAAVSVLVLLTCFPAYRQGLLTFNRFVTSSRTRFAAFVAVLAILPLALLFI